MTATLTETALTVDGIRSPILQAGPPHADEAVVFVHGNPGSSQDWARLVERTGAFARAVAWDHPGFGQADNQPASTTPCRATPPTWAAAWRCSGSRGPTWSSTTSAGPGAWPGRRPP